MSKPFPALIRIARALEAMFGGQPSNRDPLIRIARALERNSTTLTVLVKIDGAAASNIKVYAECEDVELEGKTGVDGKCTFSVSAGEWTVSTELEEPTYYDIDTKTVSVSVGEDENVTLTAKTNALSSITVKTAPTKTAYKYGETIDTTGLVITATYLSLDTKDVSEGFTVTPATMASDTEALTISYTDLDSTATCTQAVTLVSPSSIAVKTPATKLDYADGDELDTTGLVLTVTYSDTSTADIESGFTGSPETIHTGDDTVTISYTEGAATVTTTYAITVS
jgi:hypothetical protein